MSVCVSVCHQLVLAVGLVLTCVCLSVISSAGVVDGSSVDMFLSVCLSVISWSSADMSVCLSVCLSSAGVVDGSSVDVCLCVCLSVISWCWQWVYC